MFKSKLLRQFYNFNIIYFCVLIYFQDKLVKCPFNNEHRMPPSTLEVHCQKCILKKNGYDSSHSFYPSYNLSTPLAQTVKIGIFNKTFFILLILKQWSHQLLSLWIHALKTNLLIFTVNSQICIFQIYEMLQITSFLSMVALTLTLM